MAGAAMLTLAGPKWVVPGIFRDAARPVLGVMAGSAFTPVVVAAMSSWWQALPVLLAVFLLYNFLGQLYFTRVCKFDRTTAVLASMPGGLGEMSLLAMQFNADIRRLVLVHSIRILIVVSAVPFAVQLITGERLVRTAAPAGMSPLMPLDWMILIGCAVFGYLLGRPFRAFAGIIMFPLIFSAIAHISGWTSVEPPGWLVASMQVVIGCITGSRFNGISFGQARVALIQGALWTIFLLLFSSAVALAGASVLGMPMAVLFLALAPGGFAEMTIISYAIGLEVAFVVTCHVFRLFYSIAAAPLLVRLATRSPP